MAWTVYVEREGATPTPMEWKTLGFATYAPKSLYGQTTLHALSYWHGAHLSYCLRSQDVDAIDRFAFNRFRHSLDFIRQIRQQTVVTRSQLRRFLRTTLERSLAALSNESLVKIFERFSQLYTRSFGVGFIGSFGARSFQEWLGAFTAERIRKLGLEIVPVSALAILTAPRRPSLYTQANQALEKLARQAKVSEADLTRYLRQYHYIGYDYAGPGLSREKLLEHIADVRRLKIRHTKSEVKKIEKILKLNRTEQRRFAALAELSYLKELRNTTDDLAHYTLDTILDEIGRRFSLNRSALRYYRPREIARLLTRGEQISPSQVEKRQQAMLIDGTRPQVCLIGKKATAYFRQRVPRIESKGVREVRGVVAQPGNARGLVRVVRTVQEATGFQPGEILVSPMTSPAYLSAIHKAAGIVTDEGGMTSHAAIISREFRIPCVVGTKIASHVFTNGDQVEVDANNGVVRKI